MSPQDWRMVLEASWWSWLVFSTILGVWCQYKAIFGTRTSQGPAPVPQAPESPTHVQLPDGSWLRHEKTAKWVPSEDPTPPPAPTVRNSSNNGSGVAR